MDAQSFLRSERDVRCDCGSLMARLTPHGIELKCRRCKNIVVLPASGVRRDWVALRPLRRVTMTR